MPIWLCCNYRIVGKFGEFGELSVICQTKIIQFVFTTNLFIHQAFFRRTLKFAKQSPHQTLLLYSSHENYSVNKEITL